MMHHNTARRSAWLACLVLSVSTLGKNAHAAPPPKPATPTVFQSGDWIALKAWGDTFPDDELNEPLFPTIHQVIKLTPDGRLVLRDAEAPVSVNRVLTRTELFSIIKERSHSIIHNSHDTRALHERGLAEFLSHSYAEAIADFTEALRINPYLVDAYFYRGLANEQGHAAQRALGDFTQAIRIEADRAEFYRARARVAFDLKLYDRAAEDDTTALRFDPDEVELHRHRAASQIKLLRYAFAVQDLDIVIANSPDEIPLRKQRLNALENLQNLEKALTDATYLVEHPDPSPAPTAPAVAVIAAAPIAPTAPAVEVIAAAPENVLPSPNNPTSPMISTSVASRKMALLRRARIYQRMGETGKVIDDIFQAGESERLPDPSDVQALNNLIKQANLPPVTPIGTPPKSVAPAVKPPASTAPPSIPSGSSPEPVPPTMGD